MKLSPKSVIMALALGLAIVPALTFAQPPGGGAGGPGGPGGPGGGRGRGQQTPEMQVAALDTAVTLTAEQKPKVTAIYTKAAEARAALAQEDRRGPKGQEMTAAMNKEIRALLTAPQQTKFVEMLAAQAARRGGPGGPGGPGGGGNRPPQ